MPFPLVPVLAGAAIVGAIALFGGKKPREVPPTARRPPPGETPEQGLVRLKGVLEPWLNKECFDHILIEGPNPPHIAREYTTHLLNHLIGIYRGFLAQGFSVDDAVAFTINESDQLCGTFLPPGWTDISELGREAGVEAARQAGLGIFR